MSAASQLIKRDMKKTLKKLDLLMEQLQDEYFTAIQERVNKHNVVLATGHMSNTWLISKVGKHDFKDDIDCKHRIFKELKILDEMVEPYGLGPSNMMRFDPPGVD